MINAVKVIAAHPGDERKAIYSWQAVALRESGLDIKALSISLKSQQQSSRLTAAVPGAASSLAQEQPT